MAATMPECPLALSHITEGQRSRLRRPAWLLASGSGCWARKGLVVQQVERLTLAHAEEVAQLQAKQTQRCPLRGCMTHRAQPRPVARCLLPAATYSIRISCIQLRLSHPAQC